MPFASPDSPIFGPMLKLERAEHHLAKLEGIFRDHVRANAQKVRRHTKNHRRAVRPLRLGSTFPRHTPTVLGDAVHNLRAALDHVYCLLVEANGGIPGKYTYFPFADTRQNLEGTIKGQKEGARAADEALAFIVEEIQPYHGGKSGLYDLHLLDRTDKHRILIPLEAPVTVRSATLQLGSAKIHFSDVQFVNLSQHPEARAVELVGLDETRKAQISFEVVFQRGQPREGEAIVPVMRKLAVEAERAVVGLGAFLGT